MQDHTRAFLSALSRDEGMRRELESVDAGSHRQISARELVEFAAARGFTIHARELDEALEAAALGAVAGGSGRRATLARHLHV